MEAISYPCSPLVPFLPIHHEESSYLLWSPQVVIPSENRNLCDEADPIPSPDEKQDNEFVDMLIQEASDLLQDDDLSNGDPFASFDGSLAGQENGSMLAAVQEELMEESSLGDLLIAGAKAVEANDFTNASAILSRLDNLMPGISNRSYHHAAVGSSDRLACYFARGLHSRMSGACTECHATTAPGLANRMLQELSPFIKFAHFTANQAILEATRDDPDVHIVDLNVGEGVQWASLISDLARNGNKTFHLTAITAEEDTDAGPNCMTARWLSEFAESQNLPFRYSSLQVGREEDLHGLARSCSSPVIISCDTTDNSYSSLIKLQMLLQGSVRILQPKLVILIEDELFRIGRSLSLGIGSFVEFFCEALHHFTAMLNSLASSLSDGGYGVCLELVEKEMLGPRVEEAMGQYGAVLSRVSGDLEGFRACDLSSFNVAQAKMLVGLFSRGYGVVHEEGRLVLCWNSRPLTSVSVWRPV